jgi:metallo-beta-lactamase class B
MALVNSNNRGVAHLACPEAIPGTVPDWPTAAPDPWDSVPVMPPPRGEWYQEPQQVFDNLYYLGTKVHSAWAVTTSAGIILIDTLWNYATKPEIEDGMRKLGLDPAKIKYMVITHAHPDHDGGLKYMQDTFKPRVIMGPKDWDVAVTERTPPRRDIGAIDGQKLTLGDTTITIYITPGHTASTLSLLVPVKDHGTSHLAFEWGGTSLGSFRTKEMFRSYISNANRMLNVVTSTGADVIISNHTEFNDAIGKLAMLKERKPGDPNAFVVGNGEVRKYLTVAAECAKSYLAIAEGRL